MKLQHLLVPGAIWLSSISTVFAQKAEEEDITNNATNSIGTTLHLTDELRAFFSEGFDVRILLRAQGGVASEASPVIGNATLIMQGEQLLVRDLEIYGKQQDSTVLTKDLIAQIKATTDKAFDDQGNLTISNTAKLHLDVLKMDLFLDVAPEGFGVAKQTQIQHLSPSSARQLSGLMKVNGNVYHSRNSGSSSSNSTNYNIGLDSISGFAEHHMLFAANTYGNRSSDSSSSKTKIERWLYERDYNGKTIIAGMMNSWNLQTLAQVSAVNADRIYGASIGNRGSSVVAQKNALVVPIIVYFPSAGEAHIFRDDQLISIQRFPMGNHSLEGDSLPSGIYDVKVDVVVSGQTVSSRAYQVNKPADGLRFGRSIGWQIWGGQMDKFNVRQHSKDQDYNYASYKIKDRGALYGLSLAGNLYSLELNASAYRNDTVTVQESSLALPLMQSLRLRLQSLYASDSTRRAISSLTWQVPGNLLYIWANYETGSQGDTLSYWMRKNYTLGGNLYLGSLIPRAGSLSVSYDKSLQDDRIQNLRTDYNQSLYSGRWGSLSMNVGYNKTSGQGSGDSSHNSEKFINLNFSMPLRANFNMGYSQDNYTRDFNIGADMSLDGPITSIGGTVTRNMPKDYGSNRTSYTGYANYDTRYGIGSTTLQGSTDTKSVSLQNQSTLAWNSKGIALGTGSSNSGVIIQLPNEIEANQMEARIGPSTYELKGGSNLITVSPFNTYTVSIYDTGEADDSYNIDNQVNEYTLYPGNVVKLTPTVQKMVTVFGRLTTPAGEGLKNAKVSNHIGYTNTDDEGNFSIDISRTTPQLIVESSSSDIFDINFNLKPRHKGAIWLGNLILNQKTINYDLPETEGDGSAPQF